MLIACWCVSTWGIKSWWNMLRLKWNQRTANLGMHAAKVSAVTSLSWQIDQPFELQKQKHEISEPGEASVPIEPQEIKDSDSARSIISKLSEDNEVEYADLNALKKWLAKSKQQLAKFFTTRPYQTAASQIQRCRAHTKQRGLYSYFTLSNIMPNCPGTGPWKCGIKVTVTLETSFLGTNL